MEVTNYVNTSVIAGEHGDKIPSDEEDTYRYGYDSDGDTVEDVYITVRSVGRVVAVKRKRKKGVSGCFEYSKMATVGYRYHVSPSELEKLFVLSE